MARAGGVARERGSRARTPSKIQRDALNWLNDYDAVRSWMDQYDLDAALDNGDGLAWFPAFLPVHVAWGALSILEAIPAARWNATAAEADRASNNISHQFRSAKAAPETRLATLLRAFPQLSPGRPFSTFSAARYDAQHHIAPHDDRAYTPVLCDDGSIMQCSREVALVYYLTSDWGPAHGGAFVDIQGGGAEHAPSFNTAVAFRIPRWHAVTPVAVPQPRYSVFGWFLTPGRAYPLDEAVRGAASREDGEEGAMEPLACKLGRRLLLLDAVAGVQEEEEEEGRG